MSAPVSTSLVPAATLSVRFLGVLFILLGGWQLVSNLIDGWIEFDPTYLGYFFRSQLLRPAVACALGVILIVLSRPLARALCRGLEK